MRRTPLRRNSLILAIASPRTKSPNSGRKGRERGHDIKLEATETKRDGKPGKDSAQALGAAGLDALLAEEFAEALTAANRAHTLLPDGLDKAIARTRSYSWGVRKKLGRSTPPDRASRMSGDDSTPWERVIAKDFADLRKTGLSRPMMEDIAQKLGVSPAGGHMVFARTVVRS